VIHAAARHRPSARVRAQGRDLTIVSYGNGLALSLAAAERLEREHGLSARVLDCAGSRRYP